MVNSQMKKFCKMNVFTLVNGQEMAMFVIYIYIFVSFQETPQTVTWSCGAGLAPISLRGNGWVRGRTFQHSICFLLTENN